ncbi:DNA polymerase I [Arthrobacter sp. zg-Y820]|uniref:DNA polymerase I n=2 Tax=Arthrobacter TaxID=1663 RepID=UPI0024C28BC6|nr:MULTISPECIES: DNA polymerase I [unclassified Arthrobacter]MDK1279436.1 DNA polymerase I [Arthrobacter sp. zg.Y820]WIB08184.1 DNA polymerase I [Arthrobacter sp. zg-Y820]
MSESTKLADIQAEIPAETVLEGAVEPAPEGLGTATAGGHNRLLVIDGHSMAFRAFYALPAENFSTDTGQHTNAVYGFTSMLINLIKEEKPTHLAVAFDLDTPTFRSEEYTEYKGGRNKTPEEFHGQIDLIIKVMEAMRIPTLSLDGYEADDILATLAEKASARNWDVMIVSGDRDAFQLVDDRVTVFYPKKGVSDLPRMDAAAVEAKYLVPPDKYSDLAALVGETADNLPGVPGVGPKTAAKWIKQYGGLEGILENLDSIKGKVGDSLRANIEDVKRNRRLNRLLRDLDLPVDLDAMSARRPDREAIEELFDALQFNALRKRLFDVYGEEETASTGNELTPPEHVVITEAAALKDWIASTNQAKTAVQLVTEGAAAGRDVVGLALVTNTVAAYVPLTEIDAETEQVLAGWLADLDAPKVVHDFKEAYKALAARGLHLAGEVDDTAVSGYLIQPDRRSYDLPDLSQHHLRMSLAPAAAASNQLQLQLEEEDVASPAVLEAFAALQLSDHFAGQLVERGANQLLGGLELPLSEVLAEMELAGIAVDTNKLDRLLDDFSTTIANASSEAFSIIGKEINLGSPKQLQVVLFDELGLPKTKKIKTGYSTDADALADLIVKTGGHPFLAHLMAYRDATKLRQTVEGLRKAVSDDGRVHTTYVQTAAATGRLSSTNPNLQNIPIRSEEGRRIREVFTVGEGYETLLTADYSQVEMRIMAHLSGDEGLISAFRAGEDLHRFVGAHIFGVPPEDVTSAMRSKVKAMSYGLVYGLSSFGLSKQLAIPVDEARTLMRDYFDRFGAVRDYLRGVVEQARKDGFTSTIEGRRRYLPDLSSDNRQLREMAERAALNAPIQGSAADIIKKAMLGVDAELKAQGLKSRMLLQVHDELVLEVASGEQDAVEKLVREQMASAADLSVPLDVSVGIGVSWHEAGH